MPPKCLCSHNKLEMRVPSAVIILLKVFKNASMKASYITKMF